MLTITIMIIIMIVAIILLIMFIIMVIVITSGDFFDKGGTTGALEIKSRPVQTGL